MTSNRNFVGWTGACAAAAANPACTISDPNGSIDVGAVVSGSSNAFVPKLAGIADTAAKVFGVPAHLGEAPTWVSENLRDPGFHTALGLLYYGVSSQTEKSPPARRGSGIVNAFTRLFATN